MMTPLRKALLALAILAVETAILLTNGLPLVWVCIVIVVQLMVVHIAIGRPRPRRR